MDDVKLQELVKKITPIATSELPHWEDPKLSALINFKIPDRSDFDISVMEDDGCEFEEDEFPTEPQTYAIKSHSPIGTYCYLVIRCTEEIACMISPIDDNILDAMLAFLNGLEN